MQVERTLERMDLLVHPRQAGPAGWLQVLGIGIVTIALGILSIAAPHTATVGIALAGGLLLIVVGLMHLARGVCRRRPWQMFLKTIAGVIYGFAGVLLLAFPRQGALTMTVLIAALFIIVGTLGIASALATRPLEGWLSLLLGGILIAGLGVFIWMAMPTAAAWTLGLLAGIELLLSGRVIILSALAMWNDPCPEALG